MAMIVKAKMTMDLREDGEKDWVSDGGVEDDGGIEIGKSEDENKVEGRIGKPLTSDTIRILRREVLSRWCGEETDKISTKLVTRVKSGNQLTD